MDTFVSKIGCIANSSLGIDPLWNISGRRINGCITPSCTFGNTTSQNRIINILRLSLSTTPAADLGYWRTLQTFGIFSRIIQKESRFLNLWSFYREFKDFFLMDFFFNFWWFPFKFLNFNLIWHHWKHCFGITDYNIFLDKFIIGTR